MKITLYELFTLCNIDSTDIADNTFEFVVNFACNTDKSKCKDYYDKLMRLFATQIECNNFEVGSYTLAHCEIKEFIERNIDAFSNFMNEFNKEGYRPCDYSVVEKESDLWYDLYIATFNNLVVGMYYEYQYEKLFKLLGGK